MGTMPRSAQIQKAIAESKESVCFGQLLKPSFTRQKIIVYVQWINAS